MNLLVGLLSCAIGAGFFFLAGRQIRLAFRSKRWPATKGKITASEVWSDGETYGVRVGYEYVVAGRTFVGSEPRIGLTHARTAFRRAAEKVSRKYPVGSVVAVHYDPNEPARSVVEAGISVSVVLNMLVAIVFSVGGIVVMLAT